MKKLILLFLFLPLLSLGQNQTIAEETKFAVGFCFSPEYSYRYLQTDIDSIKFVKLISDTTETADFGFATGISVLYKLNSRFVIESGLLYSKKGYKNIATKLNAFDPNDPLIPQKISIYYTYSYFSIPLKLNYILLDKRLKLYVSAGISANFFIKGRTKTESEYSGKTNITYLDADNDKFSKLNVELLAGLGADYDINRHFKLRLEPIFRRSLSPLSDSDIKTYLYSGGLNLGVYYKF